MIVALRKYSHEEWIVIATQNNAVRESQFMTPWSNEEIWDAWRTVFGHYAS